MAHNPAAAGSLVQIQPPQPIFLIAVPYRVYVLENRNGKFYIGVSGDVARRIQQHNTGESRWTKEAVLGQTSRRFQKREFWKTV